VTSFGPADKRDTEIGTPRRGWTWCRSHKRWEREDDLIDFEVSDGWLDFYHLRGLTPRQSPKLFVPSVRDGISRAFEEIRPVLERLLAELSAPSGDGRADQAMALLAENRRLREENIRLREENARLRARPETPEKGTGGKVKKEGGEEKRKGKPI
jgi:hypothetical protein